MKIILDNETVELKYTFNSFKYMEDFDVSELDVLERKPFKIASVSTLLLRGALNNNPDKFYDDRVINDYLETQLVNGKLVDLLEKLIELLQESDFFKSLQPKEM